MAWAALNGAGLSADAGVPPKVLWRWRCRALGRAVVLWRGGECVARFCSVGQDRGATRRLVCTRAPNARSARALGMHGTCLKKCQCMLQSLG